MLSVLFNLVSVISAMSIFSLASRDSRLFTFPLIPFTLIAAMFRVLFFLILLLLALLGGCTCLFSGFTIFISGFRLAVSVCSHIVFSSLSPGVLLLILSAFVFNCSCFFPCRFCRLASCFCFFCFCYFY